MTRPQKKDQKKQKMVEVPLDLFESYETHLAYASGLLDRMKGNYIQSSDPDELIKYLERDED